MSGRLILAALGGLLCVAAAAQTLPTTTGPKAYVVGELTVTDPVLYAEYARQVPPLVARHGGRYLVRGGRAEALEGAAPARIVVVEYPNAAAARAFWNSPEYRRLAVLRHRASRGRLALVEGVPPAL